MRCAAWTARSAVKRMVLGWRRLCRGAASRAAARGYAAAGAGLSEAASDASGACGGGGSDCAWRGLAAGTQNITQLVLCRCQRSAATRDC